MAEITLKITHEDTRATIRDMANRLFVLADELVTEGAGDIQGQVEAPVIQAPQATAPTPVPVELQATAPTPVPVELQATAPTPVPVELQATAPTPALVEPIKGAVAPTTGPEGTIYNADGTVKLDLQNYPYDPRIHAKAKSTKADGTYKLTRGVDKTLVETVRAEWVQQHPELFNTGGAPAPAPQATAPAPAPQATAPAPAPQATAPAPAPQATAPAPVDPNAITWPMFLQRITHAQTNGLMNQEIPEMGMVRTARLNQLLEHFGVDGGVPMLATKPELFGVILQDLQI